MTAIAIVAQPNLGCIHVATDAAMYRRDQTVVAFGSKVFPVPHWPGLVTSAGNSASSPLFGWDLSQRFATFDELISGAEAVLPDLTAAYGLPNGADVIFVGISGKRGPEAYLFRTDDSLPLMATREEVDASECYGAPLQLVKLPDIVISPVANDQVIPANYEGIDPDTSMETVAWSLRKILEMQRHMYLPPNIPGIGGFGVCTTISSEGIVQRMLQRWPEDELGAPLRPGSIDWRKWHEENPKPALRLSRVKRNMLARKERKLELVK